MNLFNFDNSYHRLGDDFYADVLPQRPDNPELVLLNKGLCSELDIDVESLTEIQIASILSGAELLAGAEPLAMAYAGHQFGHFTMLGDGRAILLGEHLSASKKRVDIQLKGPGRTPFSRGGDGMATLRAMLREYLMSECMHVLGVPSSRSLAVVKTGKLVQRETIHEGAVLTRIMDSHLRVGTFEFAHHFLKLSQQNELLEYAIKRHFPQVGGFGNDALEFLKAVADKQLDLILDWMRIGFIHGVMNTDNMHIGGQTFDYGPCAFMNAYNPKTVFSSIDRNGRYAFGNQPEIALWNLSVLAGSILPQIDDNQERAVELARSVLNDFAKNYKTKWRKMMCAKIGFEQDTQEAMVLSERLLAWMLAHEADYTNTYLLLSDDVSVLHCKTNDELKHWIIDWKKEVLKSKSWEEVLTLMRAMNPLVIPRNDRVELALDAAVFQKDYSKVHEVIAVMGNPNHEKIADYQSVSFSFDAGYQTFCGT